MAKRKNTQEAGKFALRLVVIHMLVRSHINVSMGSDSIDLDKF